MSAHVNHLDRLPQDVQMLIANHYDTLLRKEWWSTLTQAQQEYEEWPLDPGDHMDYLFLDTATPTVL